MAYTFEILGISPVIFLFNNQQLLTPETNGDLAYLGVQKCTLDTFVESVEDISAQKNWNLNQVINTVVNFWIDNPQRIQYWKARLQDAGWENLLLARVGKLEALRSTFESLLHPDPS